MRARARAHACRAVNRKKFFCTSQSCRFQNPQRHEPDRTSGTWHRPIRQSIRVSYCLPTPLTLFLLPLAPRNSPPPTRGHPRALPATTFFPFLPRGRRKILEIFYGSPETTDSEKSPSTSIARHDVECVNTRVGNAGMPDVRLARSIALQKPTYRNSQFLYFPSSFSFVYVLSPAPASSFPCSFDLSLSSSLFF